MSTLLSNEIDILDREILFLILKGNPSPYSVWAAMNKQMQGRGLAYVNVKKRIKRMVEIDILEPAPEGAPSIRGRKEYKVTMKGMEQLIPYIVAQQENGKIIFEYIEKYGLDRQGFVNQLTNRLANIIITADSLYKFLNASATISSERVSNIRIEEIKVKDNAQQPIIIVADTTTAAAKRRKKH